MPEQTVTASIHPAPSWFRVMCAATFKARFRPSPSCIAASLEISSDKRLRGVGSFSLCRPLWRVSRWSERRVHLWTQKRGQRFRKSGYRVP